MYAKNKFNIPSQFLKYISKYIFSSEEMQDLAQNKYSPVYSIQLDLRTVKTNATVFEVNQPGRAVVIYGVNNSGGSGNDFYDPVLNTGLETVKRRAMVYVRFNDFNTDITPGCTLKTNRGMNCTFNKLYLTWPAQALTFARLVIFKYDAVPWFSGEKPQ